jgi:DNA-binding beta-propeller fold protein YncE
MPRSHLALLLAATLAYPHTDAAAQIAVSANDNKLTLIDGVTTVVSTPPPDTVTVLDLGVSPPKAIAELPVPTSIIGPPESVAIAPDESIALVTAAAKVDPADPTQTVPDDRVTVIDLRASPPAAIATLQAGAGASGVSISPDGRLALVANRIAGTISVFSIDGRTVRPAGTVDLGAPESGPCLAAFTRDGRMALVTRNNDSLISILAVDGAKVTYTKQDFATGLKPYSIQVSPTAPIAIVAHVGAGPTGGADTISVVDLALTPPRVVEHATVGPTAEGISVSPDGRHVAVTVMDNTNAPKSSPFFSPAGRLRVFGIEGRSLAHVADATVGRWCQGAAWSRDGKTLVVQCALDREILVFGFDGQQLTRSGAINVNGGPSGIRTAEKFSDR